MHGMAGIGKTSVASTLCRDFADESLLGASVFCRRDHPTLGSPAHIVSTLIHKLALSWKALRKAVIALLNRQPELASAPPGQQFEMLLATPLRKLHAARTRSMLVVIDALDECGTPPARRSLLEILLRLSLLAPWLKVILTSRPESDIEMAFKRFSNTRPTWDYHQRDLLGEPDAESDVLLFTKDRMAIIASDFDLAADWPGDVFIGRLAQKANGLFIWIHTVARFIENSTNKNDSLYMVLKARATNDAYVGLHDLYKTALEAALPDTTANNNLFRVIVGGVLAVATRNPLPEETLRSLLADQMSSEELTLTVNRLKSVLHRDHTDRMSIRIHHLSFLDFLTDDSHSHICPDRFHIDLTEANGTIAAACFAVMIRDLRFNICSLETSSLLNRDVDDLDHRVKSNIHPALEYGCIFWSSHLLAVDWNSEIDVLLADFLRGIRLLHWLEVLSLVGKVHDALVDLKDVAQRATVMLPSLRLVHLCSQIALVRNNGHSRSPSSMICIDSVLLTERS